MNYEHKDFLLTYLEFLSSNIYKVIVEKKLFNSKSQNIVVMIELYGR